MIGNSNHGFVSPASFPFLADGATTSLSLASRSGLMSHTPDDFGWNSSNTVTENTAAVQEAIDACKSSGKVMMWPPRDHEINANLNNFHSVGHIGNGTITRNGSTWHIKPEGDQENVIHVSTTGTSTNDGIDTANSTNIATAFSRIQDFSGVTLNGFWRIQMAGGVYADDGITMGTLPYFKNKLRIWGEDANGNTGEASDLNTVPSTVWDGSTSSNSYMFRCDNIYAGGKKFFHIQNLKSQNFPSGGLVIWYGGIDVLVENFHSDGNPRAAWYRGGYARQTHGSINGSTVFGISAVENCTFNFGTVGKEIALSNNERPFYIGRNSSGHIDGVIDGGGNTNYFVIAEWSGRVAMQNCDLRLGNGKIASGNGNSIISLDYGVPNQYPTFTDSSSATEARSGTVSPDISKYSQRTLHQVSGLEGTSNLVTVSGVTGKKLLASTEAGVSGGDSGFVPFRLPAYFFYNQTAELEVNIGYAHNSAHAGGTLYLQGQGSSASLLLAKIDIPGGSRLTGFINMKVYKTPGSNTARYECYDPATGTYQQGSTANLDHNLIRRSNADQLLYRLYWEPLNTETSQFFNLRTYVTE